MMKKSRREQNCVIDHTYFWTQGNPNLHSSSSRRRHLQQSLYPQQARAQYQQHNPQATRGLQPQDDEDPEDEMRVRASSLPTESGGTRVESVGVRQPGVEAGSSAATTSDDENRNQVWDTSSFLSVCFL